MLGNEKSSALRVYLLLLGLAFCLLIPSITEVQKYLGLRGLVVFLIVGGLGLVVGYRFIVPVVLSRVTEKQSLWLGGFTLVGLGMLFALV